MLSVVGKLISDATLTQNFINFYFYSLEICQNSRAFFDNVGKKILKTLTTFNKFNSLTKSQMMLNLEKCFAIRTLRLIEV
jgi:hypothetical protein